MNKMVESMTQVDFSEISVPMLVVYQCPEDFPGMYVCRVWEGKGCHPTDTVLVKKSLEEVRAEIKAVGFILKFPRAEGDDPVILETWMR